MVKYVPIPREKNITTTNYNCEHSLFMPCEEEGGGCKDLKTSQKFCLVSKLTLENIYYTFEARDQEKGVFMNCSLLHWSDKKTVDENVSLLCILIVILVCQALNCV